MILQQIKLNETLEQNCRENLNKYLINAGQLNVKDNVNHLMSIDGYFERNQYIESVVPDFFLNDHKILISGMAVGSEMIAAKDFGAGKVYGTEVTQFYVETAQKRLKNIGNMHCAIYDGHTLPFESEMLDGILSGHIIEHTSDPYEYLEEHLRVLKPGGHLFLEFPTRYYHIELHMLVPSFEWLPRILRNGIYKLFSAKLSPLSVEIKKRYANIINTHLKQVSLIGIRYMLRKMRQSSQVIHFSKLQPGIVRCIMKKR